MTKPPTRRLCNSRNVHPFWQLLAALGLAVLMGCNPAPQQPLRVATHTWPGYESVHLAQSLGYFDTTEIRLVEQANASQVATAIRNKTVDAGMLTLDETLNLIQDGMDIRVVLVMDISNGADVVMAHPEITRLQDLRGKRVTVENAAVGAVMLDAMLETAGLSTADIQLISKPVNEHAEAYSKDMTDAVVTFEPVRSELLKQGAHILFDSSRIPGRIVDVLAVRADVLTTHQQALRTLVASHFRALDYQAQHPQDAAKRIAPFLGVKENEVLAQYDGLKLPLLSDNHALLAGPAPELKIAATNLANLMLQRKLLHGLVDVEKLAEPMFLPQAPK